jgi:hypothetical protein
MSGQRIGCILCSKRPQRRFTRDFDVTISDIRLTCSAGQTAFATGGSGAADDRGRRGAGTTGGSGAAGT